MRQGKYLNGNTKQRWRVHKTKNWKLDTRLLIFGRGWAWKVSEDNWKQDKEEETKGGQ
jgi:hypothetical protein